MYAALPMKKLFFVKTHEKRLNENIFIQALFQTFFVSVLRTSLLQVFYRFVFAVLQELTVFSSYTSTILKQYPSC